MREIVHDITWDIDIIIVMLTVCLNTLRPKQNGHHFPDHIFRSISINKNASVSVTISLKCVPQDPIHNIRALVQITAWRRPGDKPLSEPMMVSLLTHICVTRPIAWHITRYGAINPTWFLFQFHPTNDTHISVNNTNIFFRRYCYHYTLH